MKISITEGLDPIDQPASNLLLAKIHGASCNNSLSPRACAKLFTIDISGGRKATLAQREQIK